MMTPLRSGVGYCLLLLAASVSAETNLREAIQVIPYARDTKTFNDMMVENGEAGFSKAPHISSFPQWITYSDEFITFDYPDHSSIELKVIMPESRERVSIAGGPVRTELVSFERIYSLTYNGATYFAMMLGEADQFDDSICLCGPVVYEKYLPWHGALFRFSLLSSGDVKRIQARLGDMRVVFFEWTHLPIHQDVMLRLADSLRLKTVGNLDELIEQTRNQYGGIGFIEKGMTTADIIALMGEPTESAEEALRYVSYKQHMDGAGRKRRQVTVTIPIQHGLFPGLDTDHYASLMLPPERGSPEWILEKAEYEDKDSRSKDYDLGPLTEAETDYLFERALEQYESATPVDWRILNRAMYELYKQGIRDPRVVAVVRKQYLNPELPAHHASWVLHKYEPNQSRELFAQRLAWIYETEFDEADFMSESSEVGNLLSFTGRNYPGIHQIVERGLQHENDEIRWGAYTRVNYLDRELAMAYLQSGMKDRYHYIRSTCAREFTDIGTIEDIAFLEACREAEKNERVVGEIDKSIQALKKKEIQARQEKIHRVRRR